MESDGENSPIVMVTTTRDKQKDSSHEMEREEERVSGLSALTVSAIENMARQQELRRRKPNPGTKSFFRDNTTRDYAWLLPGWLAEERFVASGRLYRFYYDPSGTMYRTKHEVLAAWERSGLIVID